MHKIILATGNLNKVREISASLQGSNIEIMPQSMFNVPDADETGTTFVENAIIKAGTARLTPARPPWPMTRE